MKAKLNWFGCMVVLLLQGQCYAVSVSHPYEVRFYGADSNETNGGILQIRESSAIESSTWHFLEPDSIDLTGTRLACRQLGFPYVCDKGVEVVENITADGIFGFDTRCRGEEISLEDCTMSLRQQSLVQHISSTFNVLTVTCASEDDIEVRLTNSTSLGQGTVEYRCLDDDWRNPCFDTWYLASANTLCHQLGYGGVVEDVQVAMPTASFGNLNFYCSTVTENENIFDCLMAEGSCVSGKAVSLTCGLEITVQARKATLCDSAMSCNGNCGNATMPWCRCDSSCRQYEDCCYDFNEECSQEGLSQIQNTIPNFSLYSCQKPTGGLSHIYQRTEWFYFIKKCPSSTGQSLKELCEGSSSDDDVLRNLPVYDQDGDVFYNVFCAVCHGRKLEDLTAWRVEAEPEENYHTNEFQVYYVVLPPWDEVGKTRPCYPEGSVTDFCPAAFTGSQLEKACHDYQAPIVHQGGVTYRNPHCIQCHSIRINEFPIESCTGCQCQDPFCFLKCPDGRTGRLASVTLLFDFFTSDEIECTGVGEIYDMFLERCRVLVCPPGTTFVSDKCVSTESMQKDPALQSTMDCLTSAIASSLTEVAEIITDHNVTSNVNSAFIFAENVNDVQSVALTLGAIFDYSNEMIHMMCNLSDVMLIAPPPFNDTIPNVCREHIFQPITVIRDEALRAELGSAWDLNKTHLMFNEYHYVSNTSTYTSSQPSGICWFALLNTLICELQVVPEEKFAVEGNLAIHIPSGAELTVDEYFLLLNGSYVVCADSLDSSVDVQSVMYLVGASMSILCLLATLVTYTALPKLRNVAGKCLMNIAVALLGANLIFVLNPLLSYNHILCSTMAALAHFFWLGCFSWMNVAGFNMARTFGWNGTGSPIQYTRSCSKGTLVSYILYGWGVPLAIVTVGIIFHFCQCIDLRFQYGGPLICWIDGERRAMMYAVGIPIYSSILLNVLLLGYTAVSLIRHRREGRSLRANQTFIFKENLTIVAKLSVILGTSWTFGVVYSFTEDVVVMYIFVTLTSLQGVLLFVFFGLTGRIRRMWKAKFRPSVGEVTVYTVKGVSSHWRDSAGSPRGSTTTF